MGFSPGKYCWASCAADDHFVRLVDAILASEKAAPQQGNLQSTEVSRIGRTSESVGQICARRDRWMLRNGEDVVAAIAIARQRGTESHGTHAGQGAQPSEQRLVERVYLLRLVVFFAWAGCSPW